MGLENRKFNPAEFAKFVGGCFTRFTDRSVSNVNAHKRDNATPSLIKNVAFKERMAKSLVL